MKPFVSVKDILDFNNTLSNMKETDYKNSLAVSALIELLTAKGLIGKDELSQKLNELECASLAEIIATRSKARVLCGEDDGERRWGKNFL